MLTFSFLELRLSVANSRFTIETQILDPHHYFHLLACVILHSSRCQPVSQISDQLKLLLGSYHLILSSIIT